MAWRWPGVRPLGLPAGQHWANGQCLVGLCVVWLHCVETDLIRCLRLVLAHTHSPKSGVTLLPEIIFRCVNELWDINDCVGPCVTHPGGELSSYPGYFREPHWFSMGLLEISRVTLTGMPVDQLWWRGPMHECLAECKVAGSFDIR